MGPENIDVGLLRPRRQGSCDGAHRYSHRKLLPQSGKNIETALNVSKHNLGHFHEKMFLGQIVLVFQEETTRTERDDEFESESRIVVRLLGR